MRAMLVAVALLAPMAARADVSPPAESACSEILHGRTVREGEPCQLDSGAKGTCQESTCTHLDYSTRGDGGSPGSKTAPCLLCLDADGNVPVKPVGGCGQSAGGPAPRDLAALSFACAFAALVGLKRRRS